MASTINASTSPAAIVQTADGTGILALQTGNTTAVTIDASQNVGIGTTSPALKVEIQGTVQPTLVVRSTSTGLYDAGRIWLNASGASANQGTMLYHGIENTSDTTDTTFQIQQFSNGPTYNRTMYQISYKNQYQAFSTNGSERMRIDSVGRPLFNTTSALNAGYMSLLFDGQTYNGFTLKTSYATTGSVYLYFINSAGNVAGFVSQNGTTTVSYTTSSDYRLKENIVPMTGALDKVLQLKPVNYTWKQDGLDGQGFIAHELQTIVPDAVVGEKDAVDAEGNPKYQGIDTSFLVATLTAAIQEQQALITSLTARITALEGASL